MIALGPFDLDDKLGAGAMGVVWSGVHRARALPVAVKVLRPTRDRDRQAHAFRAEVRAMARLDHPSICYVHDCGFAPAGSDERSGGIIEDGAPYLAMELLHGLPLQRYRGRLPWPQLRVVLLGLLDALGHAHARGVLHLDLKPANIIVDPDRWTLKLTDFGLARLRDDDGDDERLTGTPAYMAPEQVQGRGRSMGPWTDLYAVGCLGFTLANGKSPFARRTVHETLLAQLGDETPSLESKHPMPAAFEAWLGRLLAKSPRARFRHTADAAWALAAIPEPSKPPGPLPLPSSPAITDSSELESTLVEPVVAGHVESLPHRVPTIESIEATGRKAPRAEAPPLPPEAPRDRRERIRLGVGLFEQRPLPIVGRTREREALWQALAECHRASTVRSIVIRGRRGAGKRRLIEWLGTSANEVGGAQLIRSAHGAEPGPGQGLGPMFAQALHCDGLATESIPMHLLSTLGASAATDALDWRMWSDLIGGVRMPRAARHSAALGLLKAMTSERPVILWIDDAQWAPDALAFADSLFDPGIGDHLPVLVVCTVSDDEVDVHPEATQRLIGLNQRGASMALDPLSVDEMAELVRAMADLDDRTVLRVVDHTEGHPQFAVQLMRHWVSQGYFEHRTRGVHLKTGARVEVPPDLQSVWSSTLRRFLRNLSSEEQLALELAATLGLEVDEREWYAIAREAGADPSPDLLSALLDARLARGDRESDRWAFTSAPFRETILEVARSRGTLTRLHRACAVYLDGEPAAAERSARHWMETGAPEPAIQAYDLAFEESIDAGDLVRAGWMLEAQSRAIDAAACPPDDPRRALHLLHRSRLMRSTGSADTAELDARAALSLADEHDWRSLRLDALEQLGTAQTEAGAVREGALTLEHALRSPEPVPDPKRRMRLGLAFARACVQLNDTARARSAAKGTFTLADRLGADAYAAYAQLIIAGVATDPGRREAALVEAEARFGRSNHRTGLAEVHMRRGDVAREAGDFGRAKAHYHAAEALFRRTGSARLAEPMLALGQLLLEQGLAAEADQLLDETRNLIKKHKTRKLLGPLALLWGAAAAELATAAEPGSVESARRWEACQDRIDEAGRNLLRSEIVNLDVARWAEHTRRLALAASRTTIAARAHTIALAQHRALGDQRSVDRLLGVPHNGPGPRASGPSD